MTGHLITCLAVAGGVSDPDRKACEEKSCIAEPNEELDETSS